MTKSKLSQGLKKAQSRLLNINSKKILNSVILLYVVLFASIADLLYLVSTGAHSNVIIFILIAYVTSMFSKNMTVILITALAITNIYHLGRRVVLKEGFEDADDEDDESKDEDDESKDEDDESKDEDDESKDEDDESKDEENKDEEPKSKNVEKLPEEYKKTLAQLSDPETLKTIEGLKSLEPLIGKMERVIGMFNS
tara:strand:+ start:2322 stop:2912 length:591 start_codon:yes stop_codon:yes gene_type:complete